MGIENGLVLNEHNNIENIFDENLIISNFKKFDSYYQNNLNPSHFDERFIFREKKLATPSKLGFATPLSQKGMGIKRFDTAPFKKFTSHRILNYNVSDHVNISSNLIDIVSHPLFNSNEKYLEISS